MKSTANVSIVSLVLIPNENNMWIYKSLTRVISFIYVCDITIVCFFRVRSLLLTRTHTFLCKYNSNSNSNNKITQYANCSVQYMLLCNVAKHVCVWLLIESHFVCIVCMIALCTVNRDSEFCYSLIYFVFLYLLIVLTVLAKYKKRYN